MNDKAVDAWTLVHFTVGVLAGAARLPFWTFLAVGVAYEVWEHSIESPNGSPWFGSKRPESLANVAADLCTNSLGWYAGRRWM